MRMNQSGVQVNETLLSFLQANTQGMKYLLAVSSSHDGADYVLATGRAVLYLGGFGGQDQVETGASLAKLVADGELCYISMGGNGGGPGGGNQSNISSWVTSSCKMVQNWNGSSQTMGGANGTSSGTSSSAGPGPFRGGMQAALYDCGS
jgi:hypothetical protein